MKCLTCLLFLGAALAAGPVLAKVTGAPDTVAVVSPPLSTSAAARGGCTPINPCAVTSPDLGNVSLPAASMPPQPDLPATNDAPPAAAPAAAAPAAPGRVQAANPNCPPAGARGPGGQFAGRGGPSAGQAGAEGFRRFAQAGSRNGGAEGGRGFGAGGAGRGQANAGGAGGAGRGGQASRGGQQFAMNGQGRGAGFARGGDGCPRSAGASGQGRQGRGRGAAPAQPTGR